MNGRRPAGKGIQMANFEHAGSSRTGTDLRKLLQSIDRKGYPAYKQTKGRWSYGRYILSIDHVQGDPFASPSKVSVTVPARTALFPEALFAVKHRRIALQDHLLRRFGQELSARERRYAGSGKSGLIASSRPGQEILERTACRIDPGTGAVTVRFEIGFPANGRTINAGELIKILEDFLPEAVSASLVYSNLDKNKVQDVVFLADDCFEIRKQLPALGLCAFVANGSVLPRQSGVSDLPMKGAVPFESPGSMEITLKLPHKGEIRGMGIRKGVTLIIGGGYHGKSTLLQALERGVYDHIRGDGREYVITDPSAVKVRAEDGRRIAGTDISMFIHDLPNGKDTVHFTTEDASGSTSQAANVVEAWEAGTGLLLMDEDTSATNFMVRDELMARVVSGKKEPITPFISRIRALYEQADISTILVAGSSGAFFYVADTIIMMDRYCPREITQTAKRAAEAVPGLGTDGSPYDGGVIRVPDFERIPVRDSSLLKDDRIRLKVLSENSFLIQKEEVQLRALEQVIDREQINALAHVLKYAMLHAADGKKTVSGIADLLEKIQKEEGPEAFFDGECISNGLAAVRKEDICAMLSRYRRLKLKQ